MGWELSLVVVVLFAFRGVREVKAEAKIAGV